ncbi:hypothetical protein AAMO2058_001152500 [Amorphochlora amoebiformis]
MSRHVHGKKKKKPGINVDKEELKQAFMFFDTTRKGYITLHDLRTTLSVFNHNLGIDDLKFLMNNKKSLSEADLYQMLANNILEDFNPVHEAFQVFANDEKRSVMDMDKLMRILTRLGIENVTEDDIKIIRCMAGVADGEEFSYEHFLKMLDADPSRAGNIDLSARTSGSSTHRSYGTLSSRLRRGMSRKMS